MGQMDIAVAGLMKTVKVTKLLRVQKEPKYGHIISHIFLFVVVFCCFYSSHRSSIAFCFGFWVTIGMLLSSSMKYLSRKIYYTLFILVVMSCFNFRESALNISFLMMNLIKSFSQTL